MQNTVKDAFEMARSIGNLIELTDLGVQLPTTGMDRASVAERARMLMGRRALSSGIGRFTSSCADESTVLNG